MASDKVSLLTKLIETDVFRVGSFKLKSGTMSPFYVDLRGIIAHPEIVNEIAFAIETVRQDEQLEFETVCGVPYTALPIATLYSANTKTPMVMRRKEAKDYGTKKMVEGITKTGVKCLIIEDIVSSGSSVIETAEVLRREGLIVTGAVVVLNRNQGGADNIQKAGIKLHSLFTINDFFKQYCEMKNVDMETIAQVEIYLKENSVLKTENVPRRLSFSERASLATQPVLKRLLNICATKNTNLCVAVDVHEFSRLLELADKLGPHICALKTHIDILDNFSESSIPLLMEVAKKHNFLLFEDRKFSDIGTTVSYQYSKGMYRIKDWADLVTVQGNFGSGVLQAMSAVADPVKNACIMIAERSSKGSVSSDKEDVIKMAAEYPQFVIGFVAQSRLKVDPNLVIMSPGVNLQVKGDSAGQQYKSPDQAVSDGADIVIVGRGVTGNEDPITAAVDYKEKAYKAYVHDCSCP